MRKTSLLRSRSPRQRIRTCLAVLVVALATAFAATAPAAGAPSQAPQTKPTVVLVHGAFAGSSSWNPVLDQLISKGYPVVAVANPLRGVKSDATYVADVLKTVKGPIVLVGHSYGGLVISGAASGNTNVKALVYVAGFAPQPGESGATLSGKFPGSTLAETLAPPVALTGGGKDIYIQQDKFWKQFAADVPEAQAKEMAATQRPVTQAGLSEAFQGTPAWKSIPSYFIYGSLDKNIPAQVHAFMAKRAGAKQTVAVDGASHVVMISHPDEVATMIDDAAAAK